MACMQEQLKIHLSEVIAAIATELGILSLWPVDGLQAQAQKQQRQRRQQAGAHWTMS